MKKFLFIAALTCSLVSCSKMGKDANLNLSGEIKGLKQGTIYIQTANDSAIVTLDSIVFDGKSTFNTDISIDEPRVLYLNLNRGTSLSPDNHILFFAEPGKMTINSTLEQFSWDAKIEGSENQNLLNAYNGSKRNLTNLQTELIRSHVLYSKSNNAQQLDTIERKLNKVTKHIYLNAVTFALKHKDKEVAPYIALTEIAPVSAVNLDSIQKALPDNISKSLYGKVLKEYLDDLNK